MKKLKRIPKFKSEEEEREFWSKHSSDKFIDWSKSKKIHFKNLKPSTKTISIRLPENLLNELKILANKQDISYQALIKMILKERVERELKF